MTGSHEKIPAALLTGFLGSGKTTVLNRFVRDSRMARALVVINELGEIGIDHELVERAEGDILLLQSGCLCCTMRSDLVDTLQAALDKAERGEIEPFDRVVVETTGLADPQPIMQAFLADPMLARRFELRSIMTTVDALTGVSTLDRHAESVKQVAIADRILLTKTDLAGSAGAAGLVQRLRGLNRMAPIEPSGLETVIDPSMLWDGSFGSAVPSLAPERERGAAVCSTHGQAGCPEAGCAHEQPSAASHSDLVRTFTLLRDEPIAAEALDRWLIALLDLRGPDLLRFKAIVNVAELTGPLVLHGVQHVIHPPLALRAWPSSDRRTRMVFITYGAREAELRAHLKLLEAG